MIWQRCSRHYGNGLGKSPWGNKVGDKKYKNVKVLTAIYYGVGRLFGSFIDDKKS